ncbi:MAG: flagellar basal-body MS-ring/collar protein FliF [Vicinamibacterales bacterium]
MNPDQLLAPLKRLGSTLTPRQLATLAAAFIGVVGVVAGSAYWMNTPSYTLLYADLDPESANAVVAKLKTAKIDYVLDDGGRAVRVPMERVDELRLDMAAQGLPTTGRIGFEIFDRTAFGTTEFLEQVNFRRGLEGELGRTIGTIAEVASARVHIALPKASLFTGDNEQAKASVVLKLRNNKPLAPSTVAGIAGLVAASVESLRPESVVIIDTFGRPLSPRAGAEDEVTGGQPLERQQRLERDLSAKVVALLEPVVGPGHVRVNVSARLNGNSQEETEERWDPTTVIRSRQSSTDATSVSGAAGVAGARANTPLPVGQAPKPVVSPAPVMAGRSSETTNFEVSKLTRHTVAPRGQLARLSVAVILDDVRTTAKDAEGRTQTTTKPRDAGEVERIKNLVAAAVGLDSDRGDQLTVENISFGEVPVEDVVDPSLWQRIAPPVTDYAPQAVRLLGILLMATFAFSMVLRPMVRAAFPAPAMLGAAAAPPGGLPQVVRTVADLEGEIEAELDASTTPTSAEARRLPVLTKRIARKAETEPEQMARLVRSWLIEEDR